MVYVRMDGKEGTSMPWKETRAMDQRVQFIGDWQKGTFKKVELCRVYGISRVTADKWIERYEAEGVEGLKERSRRPARASVDDERGGGGADRGDEASASEFWTEEGDGPIASGGAWAALAGRQHGGGDPEAGGAGKGSCEASAHSPGPVGAGGEQRAWPELECGLQGGLSPGGRTALLPSDHHRQLQPLRVAVPGVEPHHHPSGATLV